MSCGKCIGIGESKLWLDEQDNLWVQYDSSTKMVGSGSRLEQLIKKLYDEAIQMDSYSPPSSPALRIGVPSSGLNNSPKTTSLFGKTPEVPNWQTASYSPPFSALNNSPKTTSLFGKTPEVPNWQTASYSPPFSALNNSPKTTRLFGKTPEVPNWQTASYSPPANKGGRFRRTKKSNRRRI